MDPMNAVLYFRLLSESVNLLASSYMAAGQPVLAACILLAADKVDESVAALINGGCLNLAVSVGRELNSQLLGLACQYLAEKCVLLNKWYVPL